MTFTSAIIVAAGKGTRMGPHVDKLFLEVAGHPVVAHSWAAFDACPLVDEIVLVIRDPLRSEFEKLQRTLNLKKPVRFASGGVERQNSEAPSEGLCADHRSRRQEGGRRNDGRPGADPDASRRAVGNALQLGIAHRTTL